MLSDKKNGGTHAFFLFLLLSAVVHFLIVALFSPDSSIPLPYSTKKVMPLEVSLKNNPAPAIATSKKTPDISILSKSINSLELQDKEALPEQSSPSITLKGEYFYHADELDALPRPIQAIEVNYPLKASENGVTGLVKLELFIDETGKIVKVSILESIPPEIFDGAATEAFANKLFLPAKIQENSVKSRIITIVRFEEGNSHR